MTWIFAGLPGGSTAAKESSCWASRCMRGVILPSPSSGATYGGTAVGRPGVAGPGLVEQGGNLDAGVQVQRVDPRRAAVGGTKRELGGVRPCELPLGDVARRDAQSQQRVMLGLVDAGGQRPVRDHGGGGAG